MPSCSNPTIASLPESGTTTREPQRAHPGLDSQLDGKVIECVACQSSWKSSPKAPLHPWEWPTKPWVRLHVDFSGPFLGKTLMVIVDAHSKWLEASIVSSLSAEQAIRVLRHVFSTHGLPELRQWVRIHKCTIPDLCQAEWV